PMTSRLRLAVMASHRAEELAAAARVLAQAARAVGFDPRATRVFEEEEFGAVEAEPVAPYEDVRPALYDDERAAPFDHERIARAA
ncbi:MAG: hypothetical protein WB557_08515, partial [Solirubrobacteraceae bacterium]